MIDYDELTNAQSAALTTGLSHPLGTVTASPQTTRALERRGLVVDRQLTPIGYQVANSIGASYTRCSRCRCRFPGMKTLPTTGKDYCPKCVKALCLDITRTRTVTERRSDWFRKHKIIQAMNASKKKARKG